MRQLGVRSIDWFILNFASCVIYLERVFFTPLVVIVRLFCYFNQCSS